MLAPGLYTGLQVEWMMTWMLNHSSYCRSRASFWGISVKITANDVSALASWEFLFSEKQWRSRWLCETALAFFLNRSMDEGRGRVPAHIVCIFPSQHERKWTQRLNIQTVHCARAAACRNSGRIWGRPNVRTRGGWMAVGMNQWWRRCSERTRERRWTRQTCEARVVFTMNGHPVFSYLGITQEIVCMGITREENRKWWLFSRHPVTRGLNGTSFGIDQEELKSLIRTSTTPRSRLTN